LKPKGGVTVFNLIPFSFMKSIVESNFKEFCAYKKFAVTKNNIRRRIFIKNCIQRTGLYAGWELEFRLPGPLLIKNILMKLKLMLNIVCPARTDAWLCNDPS
jgi:hypothetical protein